ncbi:MAG: Isoleucine--tRNA ligase [Bacteroidetes bacterium ADurb.Bin217]|nr:MAG: Isoleucine--tRNA ligase [Bacteroidetes bacterium ADurb.Bin217]
MNKAFKEYSGLDLSAVNKDILAKWIAEDTFKQSIQSRQGSPSFVFYEGPPSANGLPGIHHVMARAIKDIFCRFKTMQGYQVHRKAGWDTHGLPVELGVEKELGITKEDIGKKISVEEYNQACRQNVMKHTSEWENLTQKIGYWVDMEHPYITYDNKYIETIWYLLKQLFDKGLLYKGYTIQPYSPAAGTGLSSHELNQPGCYRDVKDTTCVAQFKVISNAASQWLLPNNSSQLFILAWTTTPWTLPSNTALCVGSKITYVQVQTFNPYTAEPILVVLAKERVSAYFSEKGLEASIDSFTIGEKILPYRILQEFTGDKLCGISYEQLIPWVTPQGKAFEVISGDFVTTQDGTGIVHIAPTFGADDAFVAKQHGITGLYVIDSKGNQSPLVDKQGRMIPIADMDAEFVAKYVSLDIYEPFAGRYVKNEYDDTLTEQDATLDVDISVELKKANRAFKVEKHVHNYPHCWRTDKPILYYPLDSWFIQTPKVKDRLIELNSTINWKPASTGTGRFGKWLENLQDWNLSRSRYWGTPLPIWVSEDKTELLCIGSLEELQAEIEKSIAAGIMQDNPLRDFKPGDFSKENYAVFDMHRPFVDRIVLVSKSGAKMFRETDLIDVWFDSGAMPYAQLHYPFENKEVFKTVYPADFIAEGVDQTRGWFFTLHALATMLFDTVAFKNVISNGLVLDKNGNKMSKRLGNAVDPFKEIEEKGSDPLRWYMVTNASPWDNLKYDSEGIDEVKRKFFGTLYNTYSFFSLYANLDSFAMQYPEIPYENRPELDRWILSLLHTLIKDVTMHYESYEPTKAGRCIQDFVMDNVSNWFVRLSRKRYWKGEMNEDKISAYQTLYTCLETVALLMAPIAPFYSDRLFSDLNAVTGRYLVPSVHLADFPKYNQSNIDVKLEERMAIAQTVSSMILALRRKVAIKVRQPLQKVIIPKISEEFAQDIATVAEIIKTEVNVKEIELLEDASGILVKKVKLNFKALGPKYGKIMKQIAQYVSEMKNEDIFAFEKQGILDFEIEGQPVQILVEEVEIISEDIPGWQVANEGIITVALDTTITTELLYEGIAREFVNRIQNFRKEIGLEVTDKICLEIQKHEAVNAAISVHSEYIKAETLCAQINLLDKIEQINQKVVEIDNTIETIIAISKA